MNADRINNPTPAKRGSRAKGGSEEWSVEQYAHFVRTGERPSAALSPTAVPEREPAGKSPLAVKFEQMWAAIEGPVYVTELQVAPDRGFRFDYAWPERVALELQGGIYLAGRGGHVSPRGVKNDCEKLNLATSHDWRCFKLATGQITFENLDLIVQTILRLRQAAPEWQAESRRLFTLARITGEARHAEAARNAS